MKFRNLWRSFLDRLKAPVLAVRVDELPEDPEPRRLYLIGDAGEDPWQAAMICPCGCGSTLRLSLVPGDRPRWSAKSGQDDLASLWPSVARVRGCSAHFILSAGRVRWV